jgi:hypothetical protein
MIIGIAVLSILLFIACVALFVQRRGLVILEEKYWDENRLHLDTKVELEGKWHNALDEVSKLEAQRFEQWERAEVLEQKNIYLKQEILELSNPPPNEEAEEETEEQGNFVRLKRMKRATSETYRNLFDLDVNGQRVLEHLTMVFCKDAFVPDDKGGERETCYRLGSQSVINFIINNINQANNPNYKE